MTADGNGAGSESASAAGGVEAAAAENRGTAAAGAGSDEPTETGGAPAGERYNRLASEKSPYLLQHAANPVDWYPWGEEAFEKARREDRPVFLSIGYSTCHWCHVMERESFEDTEVARLMNEAFVSIKVDREERPDVDGVYMTVCQMMTGGGGWPLNVLLTPDKRPFFAGTYFPKRTRGGRIGMLELVPRLERLWEERREDVERSAEGIVEALRRASEPGATGDRPGEETLRKGREQLGAVYDELQGGFGGAPRFPTPHNLLFLLRWWRRTGDEETLAMVEHTLRSMRRGGIFDQVGYGFHRYSTDARWLVPHFEKMLYDQALLVLAYAEAHLATGDPRYRRTAAEVIEYLLRDMRDPGGGFHSAEDADSEGREGKFYLWTQAELRETLGEEDAALAKRVFDTDARGNFAEEATGERTGENILHLPKPMSQIAADEGMAEAELRERLAGIRRRLFEARERRVRPARDDKVLTDWNGLAIAALAFAGRTLGEPAWVTAAAEAAEFVFGTLRGPDGRLLHRYRDGEAAIPATADDYACLIWGMIELYQADFEPRWLREALRLMDGLLERFRDAEGGGFFTTAADAEELPVRRKEIHDGATPSANSVAYFDLLRLARLAGRPELEERAAELEAAFATAVRRAPTAQTMFLAGLDFRLGPSHEVVVVGEPGEESTVRMLRALRGAFAPNAVHLFRPAGEEEPEIARIAPFTLEQRAMDGRAAAYVCRDFACRRPTADPEEAVEALTA